MVGAARPHGLLISVFWTVAAIFIQIAPQLFSRAGWIRFQKHWFSENLVAPGMNPGTSPRTTKPERRSVLKEYQKKIIEARECSIFRVIFGSVLLSEMQAFSGT
jgi:hypothetical protein